MRWNAQLSEPVFPARPAHTPENRSFFTKLFDAHPRNLQEFGLFHGTYFMMLAPIAKLLGSIWCTPPAEAISSEDSCLDPQFCPIITIAGTAVVLSVATGSVALTTLRCYQRWMDTPNPEAHRLEPVAPPRAAAADGYGSRPVGPGS